jgi:hypothetical protein
LSSGSERLSDGSGGSGAFRDGFPGRIEIAKLR